MQDILLQEDFIQDINYIRVIIGLIISIISTNIIKYFYLKRSISLENKLFFIKSLHVFSISILLIVTVIKSSLALSLGMVGALSVIRFRTAIKEPEQISTLLMTMAISLSIAAEKEILSLLFLFVYIIYNPKEKTTQTNTKLLLINIEEKIDALNLSLPDKYSNQINKISNLNDYTIIEFFSDDLEVSKKIIDHFEQIYKGKVKYELL